MGSKGIFGKLFGSEKADDCCNMELVPDEGETASNSAGLTLVTGCCDAEEKARSDRAEALLRQYVKDNGDDDGLRVVSGKAAIEAALPADVVAEVIQKVNVERSLELPTLIADDRIVASGEISPDDLSLVRK